MMLDMPRNPGGVSKRHALRSTALETIKGNPLRASRGTDNSDGFHFVAFKAYNSWRGSRRELGGGAVGITAKAKEY